MATDELETQPLQEEMPEEFKKLRRALQEHIRLTGSIPWQ
jgi:hypothetical protein